MKLFLLNQKYLDVAVAEAKAASFGWGREDKTAPVDGNLLLETKTKPKQFGLVKRVINIIATCAPGNLRTTLSSIQWKIKGAYKVVLTKQVGGGEKERDLANIIWHSLKNAGKHPNVNIENPDVIIDIVITSKAAYIGTRAWENEEDFESRRAHLRPELHPSSMHPALARALVNISCAKSIHDPFCGSGGILIEAGLAHNKVSGADIDPQMIVRARKNCAAYRLHPELRVADATMWIPRVQAVIADMPFGKSTTPVALKPLLEAFLHRAAQSTSMAIVGLPAEMPMPWKIHAHFSIYVHKSMTRHFYILEKN